MAGQRYSLVWDFIPNICSDALASKTGIALIKPKTYQQKGTSCHPCSAPPLRTLLTACPLWLTLA